MSTNESNGLSRRDVLATTGGIAVASTLAGVSNAYAYAGESNTIQFALVGCGGRGTGAAEDAMATTSGPTKLVAMADVFDYRLGSSHRSLTRGRYKGQVDVPKDRQFIGFDAYKKAMDCLKPGDVVLLTTPPAFRWVQFTYAIQKGLNVFMEKPVTVDGPSTRRMLKLGEESVKKGLKVGVGLMCRHCPARQELFDRIQNGEIGDVLMLRAYRQQGPVGTCFSPPVPKGESELMYQIKRFHSFLWASGGSFSDFLIHNIDESCWMKNAWPVEARGSGGRHYRGDNVDQNFDSYNVEYTFADGTKLYLEGRNRKGCKQHFASYAHGSKGSAIISAQSHWPALCATFKGHRMEKSERNWSFGKEDRNPYRVEWEDLINAIRNDKPYNEVKRGAEASLVTSMGRMACHTGQVITYDQILNHDHEFAPNLPELTLKSASPLTAGEDGTYPIPQPGINTKSEY